MSHDEPKAFPKKWRPWIISVVIHVFLFVALFHAISPRTVIKKPQVVVQIEIVPITQRQKVTKTTDGGDKADVQIGQLKAREKSEQEPSFDRGYTASQAPGGDAPEIYSGIDGHEVSRRLKLETDNKIYPFLRYLHEKIINSTTYPEVLIDHGRTGKVTVQFEIDERGRFSGKFFSLDSDDKYLATYVLRTLKRILIQPLHEDIKLPLKALRIVANFNFGIYVSEHAFPKKDPFIIKNTLNFYRYAIRTQGVVKMHPGIIDPYIDFDLVKGYDAIKDLFGPDDSQELMENVGN